MEKTRKISADVPMTLLVDVYKIMTERGYKWKYVVNEGIKLFLEKEQKNERSI